MTTRPRTGLQDRSGAGRADAEAVTDVIASSVAAAGRRRAVPGRVRAGTGAITESTPSRLTPRRMCGRTVVGRSLPAARPHAATAPRYLVCLRTVASGAAPTVSTAPAHTLSQRPPGVGELRAVDERSAPSSLQVVVEGGPPGRGWTRSQPASSARRRCPRRRPPRSRSPAPGTGVTPACSSRSTHSMAVSRRCLSSTGRATGWLECGEQVRPDPLAAGNSRPARSRTGPSR